MVHDGTMFSRLSEEEYALLLAALQRHQDAREEMRKGARDFVLLGMAGPEDLWRIERLGNSVEWLHRLLHESVTDAEEMILAARSAMMYLELAGYSS